MAPPPPVPASHGVHMNGGEGDASYAKNSTPQRRVQQRVVPLVDAAVADLCRRGAASAPRSCFGVADLGCSSGPNTLFLVSVAIDAVRVQCAAAGAPCPEIHVFLNDLPDNDFNAVFRQQLPAFLRRQSNPDAGSVLVFGAPGSFFGRLFPAGSLHLACSSFSLHWLSQVPPELAAGELLNGGNISAGRTSTPAVIDAYARQFSRDLTLFLESRAVEVVAGGWVLASLKGRSARDPRSDGCAMFDHPSNILNDMASRGLVEAAKLESYNIPAYEPCAEEVREVVDAEGSFEIVGMESYETAGDATPPACDAAGFARVLRAVHEPLLVRHFGAGGIDMDEFTRTAEAYFRRLINEGKYKGTLVHVLSLKRNI